MIGTLFAKRSLENPATPLSDPAAWLEDLMGGGNTAAGMSVSPTSALNYTAVFKGVTILSRDVARLPAVVIDRSDESRRVDKAHPAHRLISRRPNRLMTAFTFRRLLTAWMLLRGNGCAWIVRDGGGNPVELIPLHPDHLEIVVPDDELGGGDPLYVYHSPKLGPRVFTASDILNVKFHTDDGVTGVGVVTIARESIGLGLAAERHGGRFFQNNMRPSFALEHPGELGEEGIETLRKSIAKNHQGEENAWRPLILEEGMKARIMAVTNEDAQYIQSRQFQVREIANALCVPPHKLGDDGKTSFSSLEQENRDYVDSGVEPLLVEWEQEAGAVLLTGAENEAESRSIKLRRQSLHVASLEDRGNYYQKAAGGPWISRNEVRGLEDLAPADAELDDFLAPVNTLPADQLGEGQGGGDDDARARSEALLEELVRPLVVRFVRQAERRAGNLEKLEELRDDASIPDELLRRLLLAADALELEDVASRRLRAASALEDLAAELLDGLTEAEMIRSALRQYETEAPARVVAVFLGE